MIQLGILASSITKSKLSTNSYESIATVTVGVGGSSSISFTSIPSTYKHLQIRAIVQNTSVNTYSYMRFNSDTTASYSNHYLDGDGASVTAGAGANAVQSYFGYTTANSNTNMFGIVIADILDYANTNKNKTNRILTGKDMNGSGVIELASSAWYKTNAITQIDIYPSGTNFAQYSSFALYGVKG
jgi:hypothetical protein